MVDKADSKIGEDVPKAVSRRNFIRGVITSGVAVSSASYLFRASTLLHGQQFTAGVGERLITLNESVGRGVGGPGPGGCSEGQLPTRRLDIFLRRQLRRD